MTKPYDPMRQVANASAANLVGIWRYGPFAIRGRTRTYSNPQCEPGVCSDLRDPPKTCPYSNLLGLTRTFSSHSTATGPWGWSMPFERPLLTAPSLDPTYFRAQKNERGLD